MEYEREDVTYRPVEERVKDYQQVAIWLTDEQIHRQTARCMDCGTPFCHTAASGCPLDNIIPEFNEHVFFGRWRDALEVLLTTNPFPEFTGRICPAPCEGACVLGIHKKPVNICKIELAVIEKGFEYGYIKPRSPAMRRDARVAVLGSGPAGLAAAHALNQYGFQVVVFENDRKPGGLLRYGIPDFKLGKHIIDRRINLMKEEGIIFETDVDLGGDISYRYLAKRFDAIVIAGGARQPRDIDVPGRDLEGIHFAMDFLSLQNKLLSGQINASDPRLSAKGKRVAVIGGGDTGSDCIGTSWRQGAIEVHQLEIMPEPPRERSDATPWPMWPVKRRDSSSHQEGGERMWNVSTQSFTGSDGKVSALKCIKVEWQPDRNSGRMTPREIPGSEFTIEADLVLLAMGFVGPGKTALIEQAGVERDQRGFVIHDHQHMTNMPGIFVAGDMWRGASLVVHAISDGLKAARDVANWMGTDEHA